MIDCRNNSIPLIRVRREVTCGAVNRIDKLFGQVLRPRHEQDTKSAGGKLWQRIQLSAAPCSQPHRPPHLSHLPVTRLINPRPHLIRNKVSSAPLVLSRDFCFSRGNIYVSKLVPCRRIGSQKGTVAIGDFRGKFNPMDYMKVAYEHVISPITVLYFHSLFHSAQVLPRRSLDKLALFRTPEREVYLARHETTMLFDINPICARKKYSTMT